MNPCARAILLACATLAAALLLSCTPYELRSVLDGPNGKALSITPSATAVPANNSISFAASGGVGPYVYSVISGGGSVDPASGVYTAPGGAGSAVIRVTDKTGKTVDASVTVQAFASAAVYQITAVPSPAGSTTGQPVSGSFTVTNTGTSLGGANVYWQVYASRAPGGPGRETLIESGSFAGLAASGSISPTYAGTWPATPGTYTIIVRASASDAPAITDASSLSWPVSSPGGPDYKATIDVAIPWSGIVTQLMSATGIADFTIQNIGVAGGSQDITWNVYLSTDNVWDPGDTLIQGPGTVVGGLAALGSTPVTITANWPATGVYFLIVKIHSADDANNANDTAVAPHPCAIGDYRYLEGAENNKAKGPNPAPPTQISDTGVTLGATQYIAIEGVMDAYSGSNSEYDTYKFTINPVTSKLSVRAKWGTGYDDITLWLWDTGTLNAPSADASVNSEPAAGTFDVTGLPPGVYYVSANFYLANNTSLSAGQKYVILVQCQ